MPEHFQPAHDPAANPPTGATPDRVPAAKQRCRRAMPRAPHRLPCHLRVFDATQGTWVTRPAQTVDLSPAGLAVQIAMAVPVGSRVEAIVPRFEEPPMRVTGRVMHSRRVLTGTFQVGIEAVPRDTPS